MMIGRARKSRQRTTPTSSPAGGLSPIRLLDVELTGALPKIRYDGQHDRLWMLGRLHTEPIGSCIAPITKDGFTSDELGTLLWHQLREPVAERFAAAGIPPPNEL